MICDYEIEYPDKESLIAQGDEWIMVRTGGRCLKVRLHDYGRLYQFPGLYEEVICKRLQYHSPQVVCRLLKEEVHRAGGSPDRLRILDLGAGNGVSGECLRQTIGCDLLMGTDVIPEAREAAQRDRPGIYDDYLVTDLCRLDAPVKARLGGGNFNALVTVGALGFNDIPPRAFLNTFNLMDDNSWIAFNIKDSFLTIDDTSGFRDALDVIMGDSLKVLQTRRHRHRFALSGEPLHYFTIVGKKTKEAPIS